MTALAVMGAAAAATGFSGRVAAQDVEALRAPDCVTTAALNFRSGPGAQYPIIAVIPAGTGLTTNRSGEGDYLNVQYNGTWGYVLSAFIRPIEADPATSRPDGETQYTGRAQVLQAVNFRSGASTTAPIDRTLAAGTVVETSEVYRNGFRAVRLDNLVGWVIAGALAPVTGGGSGTPGTPPPAGGQVGYVVSAANFRMEPSYGNNVIRVLPANTVITITAERSGEFVRVQTPGDIGWVFSGLIAAGAPPTGNPGTPPAGTAATVTAALNLRASASTSAAILTVMPAGSAVTVTGAASNGFLPVTFGGRSGWASADYIRTGGGGAPTTPHGSFRTTAALNLRQGPSTSTPVLLVVPAGATVVSGGVSASGYTAVSYGGTSGFVISTGLVRI